MRFLSVVFVLILSSFQVFAQTTELQARRVTALDSLRVNGNWIKRVIRDSSLDGDARDLASVEAIRQHVANRISQIILSWNAIQDKPYIPAADTFTSNPTILGTSFGKYQNGSTPNWIGLTPRQAILDAIVQAIPPTYNAPSVSISASPSAGNYEIGSNIGTITLSRSFNQNDGGAATGDAYSKFTGSWNNLVGNTDVISSLTTQVSYRVTTSYGQGPCKNNNLGQQDCTGRIQASSVTSGSITFNPFYKRYWGFVNSQSPNNSSILALSQDNNGNTNSLSLTNITPSGSQYFVYFTRGTVNSITVNGFPSTDAFTITTYNVTNAQGFTASYTFVYSNNLQSGTINSIVIN